MTASTQIIHTEPHPFAGQTIPVAIDGIGSGDFIVEDWWDRVAGVSWMNAVGNPAALNYAMRSALLLDAPVPHPLDDEVVYGKFAGLGHLVHVTELPAPF